jgi:CRISPR-associated protein
MGVEKVKNYPYNFVSLGDKVLNRGKRVIGNNTGTLKCKLRTYSPLFIMGDRLLKNGHSEEYFLKKDNEYLIPSSTLKGEIRIIIDVLTNSAIRNVEVERLEKRLKPRDEFGTKFGIIKKIPTNKEDGEIQVVKKLKIKKKLSRNLIPGRDLKNGGIAYLRFKKNVVDKYEENHKINTRDDFMKIYTSKKENSVIGRLWVSSDIFSKKYEKIFLENEKGTIYKFSKEEYEDFKYIIKQRIEREEKEGKSSYLKEYKLKVGDPIIFEANEKEKKILHLAFSEIPRLRYKFSPLDLVPNEFHQSDSLENLSFSEKLFGTTGNNEEIKKKKQEKKENKDKKMTSLIGRIYFTDAKLNEEKAKFVAKEPITLKPLGEPHPTLLGFYLKTNGTYDLQSSKIRGRKFYWHHKDKIEKKFETFADSIKMNSKEKYNSSLQLLDFGNEFEFEVYFNNLNDDELGVLIYSLELEDDLLHKIGKGKSLGLGSCKIEIKEVLLENKNKYNNFKKSKIFDEGLDKNKYIESAKKFGYIDESKNNIKELKIILKKTNKLDFSKSPFPEEEDKNGWNTLAWFNKRKKEKLILEEILKI